MNGSNLFTAFPFVQSEALPAPGAAASSDNGGGGTFKDLAALSGDSVALAPGAAGSALTPGAGYTVSGSGLKDLAGNTMAPLSGTFTASKFLFAQVVLLDLPFAGLVKNSLFLFLGYLPRAALGVVWQFVYWSIILLLWPISGFAMVLTGLWLPAVLTMQAIYPVLNKAFDLERQIKAIRDAELDSSSDSEN